MSRSKKKNPFSGITTATTEKQDKRITNRAERRMNKQIIQTTQDENKLKHKKEVSNTWNMDKDGKVRFDPDKSPKLMRK